jgi:hypothetical protein
MNLLQQLESRVREELPGVQARLDLAVAPEASSWLDLTLRDLRATVEWRPGKGFGVSSSPETVYGEGSDELYPDVSTALNRLVAVLKKGSRRKPDRPTILTWSPKPKFNPRLDLTEGEFAKKYRTIQPRKRTGKTTGSAYGGKEGVVR